MKSTDVLGRAGKEDRESMERRRKRGKEGKGERKDAGRPLMAGWFRYDCGSRLSELHMALCKARQKEILV